MPPHLLTGNVTTLNTGSLLRTSCLCLVAHRQLRKKDLYELYSNVQVKVHVKRIKIPVPQNGLCQWWLSLGFSQRLWCKLERNPWESSTIRSIISALDPRNHHRVRTYRHLDCRCILLRSSQASWSKHTSLSPSRKCTWTVCTLKMEIDDTNDMFLFFPCFSSQSTNNHCSKKEMFHLDKIQNIERGPTLISSPR